MAARIDYKKIFGDGWTKVKIEKPDLDTMSWMSPMLLFLPILIALCWKDINSDIKIIDRHPVAKTIFGDL